MKHNFLLTAITSLMALSGTALADTGYVTIGTGTSSSYNVPYGNDYYYSTTQSIYTAAEIGTGGTIKTLAYNVAWASSHSTTSVQIYMGHTSKSSFSSKSDEENVSNMTLVYSGSPTLATAKGWEELALTIPFAYNGTDNLIIVVGRQSKSYNSSAVYSYSSTSSTQCLYRSTYYSPSYGDPSSTGNYSTLSYRANVRLGFEAKVVGQFSYIISSETTSMVCGTTAAGAVTIPTSVTIDGKNYVVTAISQDAFQNKTDITSLTIPSSVTSIGNDAFTGCTGIKDVKIEDGATELSLGYKSNSSGRYYYYGLFKDCPIETLYLGRNLSYSTHDYYSYYPGYGAPFEYQSEMKSVTIGKDVTKIGSYAFYDNNNIQSLTIGSGVTKIGSYAFYDNNNIQSLTIGSGVTEIGSNAFNYTPTKTIWLTNTPPSGYSQASGKVNYVSNTNFSSLGNTKVYSYLSSMFEVDGIKYVPVNPSERTCDAIDCTYLPQDSIVTIGKTVSYRNISMTVKHINDYVACENSNIKNLTIDADCDINQYAFYQSSNLQKVNLNNTGNIGSQAFYGCTVLQSAEISNTGNIESQAFYGCTALQSAQIRNTGDIGSQAFYGCSQLSTCTVGDAVTAVGGSAFYSCSSLPAIQLGKNIKTIGSGAFMRCTSLKKADTGDGVTAIPSYAFSGCSALETITIGEGVKSIDSYAFENCAALADIAIPSNVNKIDNYAFSGCKKLADVVIADRKEALAIFVYNGSSKPIFSDCPLDSLYIGGKISYDTYSFVYSPFYRNTSLRTVVITDEETEIYDNEFYGCTGLKNVKIGDGVKKIGDYAFSGCSSLESFGFGEGMQSIGKEAFSDCTSLTRILSEAAVPPTCGSQALEDINKWECTLYVPKENIAAYQAADQWKDFFFVEENVEFTNGIESVIEDTEAKASTVLNLQGQRVSAPVKGEIFVQQGKKMLLK